MLNFEQAVSYVQLATRSTNLLRTLVKDIPIFNEITYG